MSSVSNRTRAGFLVLAAIASATVARAAPLPVALIDPATAPAYVSACAIDNDSSGVFTPSITVSDRKSSAVVAADVAIDFIDPQGHVLGEVVASPPYGPQPVPFGAVERVACRVKHVEFVDGSAYDAKGSSNAAASVLPILGVLLGGGAAAALIGSNHGSKSSTSSSGGGGSATPAPGSSASGSSTPVPVASIVPLVRGRGNPSISSRARFFLEADRPRRAVVAPIRHPGRPPVGGTLNAIFSVKL
jgi:hypothetical protein